MRSIICVVLVFLLSCKDDELFGINSDTRTFLLVNKKWKNSAIYVRSIQGQVLRDEYTFLPDYRKDDYFFFRADSTFELNDNVVKDPIAPGAVLANGTWNLLSSEQFLKLRSETGTVFQDSVKISSINDNTLLIERPVADGVQVFSFRVIP